MKHIIAALACALTIFPNPVSAQKYKDPSLSPHERAVDLLSRLTLEEKSQLMMHESRAIPRLDIPQFNWWSEALHGIGRNGTATVFPITVGMASSFNEDLVEKVFTATSDEARAKNNVARKEGHSRQYEGLSFWTPNINIFRDPRWGRGQETYGEDPYLTTQMGLAVVRGLQGPEDSKYTKLFACAKHFAVHSGPEWNRHNFNVELLPPRDLWETYLPAFKALVQKGNVKEVMCAYQRLEGEPCCGNNRLLQQILREEWGFKGLVTSDCWAVNDFWNPYPRGHKWVDDQPTAVSKAVLSGTDLECGVSYKGNLEEAVAEGLISEEQINVSLLRLLEGRFELGDFDPDELVEWRKIGPEVIASEQHHQLALDIAHQSIVLLQNKSELLPLKKNMRIAVIGPNAADSVMLWGNYNGYPKHTTTILDGIRQKVGAENVTYTSACGHVARIIADTWYNKLRDNMGRVGMSAKYWNNRDMEGEPIKLNNYRTELAFDNGGATAFSQTVNLTDFSASYTGTMRADKTEDIELIISFTDRARIIVNGDTLLNEWGEYSDDVREVAVPFSCHKGQTYNVQVDYSQATGSAILHFNMAKREIHTDAEILDIAKNADAVVFVGGISPALEGEEQMVYYEGFKGGDRTDIDLPKVQHEIVKLLHDAGKKVVFVNCSGSAMGLYPETTNADAIVQAWYGGECAGEALADVLFGDYNPCGKLPITFYKSTDDLPDFLDYNMTNRTYRYFTGKPLWPFGYGLSYTTFNIGKASAKKVNIDGSDFKGLKVTIPVANTGDKNGAEVVQVYIRNDSDPHGPLKSLRAYKRVELNPGQKTKVTFVLDKESFEFFDEESNTMRTLPGNYTIFYGNSSDTQSQQSFTYTIEGERSLSPTADTQIRINQVGFLPSQQKIAVVEGNHSADTPLLLDKETGKTVFKPTITSVNTSTFSDKQRTAIDFSQFSKTGEYILKVGNDQQLVKINDNPLGDISKAAIKAFYFQRSGTTIDTQYAGRWNRPLGHPDTLVYIHQSAASLGRPAESTISSPYGWYDAGDYNKYIVNSAYTIGIMLLAYEHNKDYFDHLDINIPESRDSDSDLLDEIWFNLRWMLTMQDPFDGGVYHKLTAPSFESFVRPDQCKQKRYVVQKSVTASYDYAAVLAQFARIIKDMPATSKYYNMSNQLLESAKKAFDWAEANPKAFYRQSAMNNNYRPAVSTGEYGDGNASDERLWAATELYKLTGDSKYEKLSHPARPANKLSRATWGNVATLSTYETASSNDISQNIIISCCDSLVKAMHSEKSPFLSPTGNRANDFGWGCLCEAFCIDGITLLKGYSLTGNKSYLDAAHANLDYILGRNATGYCYVTGFGTKPVMHPHHRLSASDNVVEPIPGLLAGGPNPGQQDKSDKPYVEGGMKYPSNIPDESYVDHQESYASNEIAINWNGTLVAFLGWLDAVGK